MQGIVYDATRVKVCKAFYEICDYAEFARERTDALWMEILSRKQVYRELIYYIAHHTFSDQLKVCGYGLCDLYVWQMNRYNLIKDTGKIRVEASLPAQAMYWKRGYRVVDFLTEAEGQGDVLCWAVMEKPWGAGKSKTK